MRPSNCKGTNERGASEKAWADKPSTDERAAAWHAVFDELTRQNPSCHRFGTSGVSVAINEIRRLYRVEAKAALLMLRNGDSPSED
jgi:hypothetical protein